MSNILQFKKKRKYVKKKTYVIATVPKCKPLIAYGMSGLKDAKQQSVSIYKEFLNIYKKPETMFHFIKIPNNKKGDWNYKNVCKYVDKAIIKINKKNINKLNNKEIKNDINIYNLSK